jgi:hypothetical protein
MKEYLAIVQACRIIDKKRQEISDEDGGYTSPAWRKLKRIMQYLDEQADSALREPGELSEMEQIFAECAGTKESL